MWVGGMLIEGRVTVGAGTDISNGRPLAPGCVMHGVVSAGHPFATTTGFDLEQGGGGQVRLRILTLIPATAREIALAGEKGADVLFTRWREQDVDLADLARPSVA